MNRTKRPVRQCITRPQRHVWNDARGLWIYADCGHVACRRDGTPLRRSQKPAAACRSCRRNAHRAMVAEHERARRADRRARGVREAWQRCPDCRESRPVEVPVDAPDPAPAVCLRCQRRREWAAWFPGALARVQAALRAAGYRCVRRRRKSSGSCYYEKDGLVIRVSDHDLPQTAEREHYHGLGIRSYNQQILLARVVPDGDLAEQITAAIEISERSEQ